MSSVDRLAQPLPLGRSGRPARAAADEASGRPRPDLLLTVGVYLAVIAAIFPLVRVISPGAWMLGVLLLPAAILALGYGARRLRVPALGVSLLEALLWMLVVTVLFLRDTAFLGILPMPASVGQAADLVTLAFADIIASAAPLAALTPLSFLLVAAVGLLTIGIDHVVLTARMPLLAAVGLIVVSLIPSIAVPGPVDVYAFALLAAAVLFVLRIDTRAKEVHPPRHARTAAAVQAPRRDGGVTAAAVGIGAVALIVAIVAAPLFPAAVTSAGGGGRWNTIDPTLQLGSDLRRPLDAEVLTLRTDAASAPYLRAATLSSFDGKIWRPDTGRTVGLTSDGMLGTIDADDDIRVTRFTTDVRVTNLVSGWLPVAYPAVQVTGLEGEWGILPKNRTVVTRSASTDGQDYEVVADVPRPTLEQIRASTARGSGSDDVTLGLPTDTPQIILDLAAERTAKATTDYDKLLALQSWFRSSDFEYSLEAPVADGFDGTGVDAVAQFLEARNGYCIHFASAFALMARSLGMSTRIVVGYLPGQGSPDPITREQVYTVMSSQLHAWPEVHFDGIGWVPFEPTNSLGAPTSFTPASSPLPDTGGTEVGATPTASPTVAPTRSAAPEGPRDDPGVAADATSTTVRPLPWIASVLGVLVVLALPAAMRAIRRRDLRTRAGAGDAAAAWRSLQDAAIDLGIPEPPGESPRAFGQRLVAAHGAPEDDMWALIDAIERASYSPRHVGRFGPDLSAALSAVEAGLWAGTDRRQRMLARFLPRSLVVRPGSAYAMEGARAR